MRRASLQAMAVPVGPGNTTLGVCGRFPGERFRHKSHKGERGAGTIGEKCPEEGVKGAFVAGGMIRGRKPNGSVKRSLRIQGRASDSCRRRPWTACSLLPLSVRQPAANGGGLGSDRAATCQCRPARSRLHCRRLQQALPVTHNCRT